MRPIGMFGTMVAIALLLAPCGLQSSQVATRSVDFMAAPALEVGKRGCCSWHGGVCGCDGNRIVCCDGVQSPTCTC